VLPVFFTFRVRSLNIKGHRLMVSYGNPYNAGA